MSRPSDKKHVIQFFSSPNLKDWKPETKIEGFYECPDLFELPVDGDAARKKWVLTAASSEYMVGSFDGTKFTPGDAQAPGPPWPRLLRGPNLQRPARKGWSASPDRLAASAFARNAIQSGDERAARIEIGWHTRWPPADLDTGPRARGLTGKKSTSRSVEAETSAENPLAGVAMELQDVFMVAEPGKATEIALTVRGIPVVYDVAKGELAVNGHRTALPVRDGKIDLRILVDRTVFEVFADNGRVYIPMPVIPKADDRTVGVSVKGAAVAFPVLEVHEMKSIWERK